MRVLGGRQTIALGMLHAQNGDDWARRFAFPVAKPTLVLPEVLEPIGASCVDRRLVFGRGAARPWPLPLFSTRSSPNLIHHWLYRNQTGSIALSEWREASASAIVVHPSLALLLALCGRTDIGRAARPWILKLERTRRWAAERAAIKAEVKRAKETVDLIGIARAVTRLDALEAEIVAVEKTKPANRN